MKKLNLKLLLPYNWGHVRKIKVYDNKGHLLTKIMHGEEPEIDVPADSKEIVIKLDIFKSVIKVPEGNNLHLILFLDFRDRFPHKYIDTLKRKCLTGKFVSEEEFENFNLSFYTHSFRWVKKADIDRPSLILGFFIAAGLLITSIIEQDNPYQNIVFFISFVSIFSLLMIHIEKDKILLFDYKSRMIASGLAFILGSCFLDSSFAISASFIIFSFTFLLKAITDINRLYKNHNHTN